MIASPDTAAPPRPVASEAAAKGHLFASLGFIGLAIPLGLGALLTVRFPGLFGAVSLGRLRPAFMISVCLGALFLSLAGGIYYVLPRLTGAPLRGERLARLALVPSAAFFLIGIATVLLGLGDGREPFALPWWLDIPVLATLVVPGLVVLGTLRDRREDRQFPTIWFAAGGTVFLPVLYLVGNLEGTNAVTAALGDRIFTAGFVTTWVIGVGTGLGYYALVKSTDQPLASRNLARIGFWSLLFGALWLGPAQLALGPIPDWTGPLAAFFGLAVPVAVLANATNFALTMGAAWRTRRSHPAALAAVAGSVVAAVWAVLTSAGAFLSPLALTDLTLFWEAMLDLALLGVGPLLIAAWSYQAIPNLVGRSLYSESLAATQIRLTVVGVGLLALLLALAGLTTGYAWTGGSFAGAYVDAGSGWAQSSGQARLLVLLSIVPAALAGLGAVAYLRNLSLTYSRGRAVPQELLVEVGDE